MKDQDSKTTNIEFRKVHLADLNALIGIYQRGNEATAARKLTPHFGLPLLIATENNEIIGFASASFNELEEMKVNSHCVKALDGSCIAAGLEGQAERILHATFENSHKDTSQLKNSIHQFIGWLNKCSV